MRLGRGLLVAGALAAVVAILQGALAWRAARARDVALRLALAGRGFADRGVGVAALGDVMRRMLEVSGAVRNAEAPVAVVPGPSAPVATPASAGPESGFALRELRERLASVPSDDFVGRVEVLAEARRGQGVAPEELRELLLHELNVSAGRFAGRDDPGRRAEFLGHQMSGLRFLLELTPELDRARAIVARALQAPVPSAMHEELRRYAEDQLRRMESARAGDATGAPVVGPVASPVEPE